MKDMANNRIIKSYIFGYGKLHRHKYEGFPLSYVLFSSHSQ